MFSTCLIHVAELIFKGIDLDAAAMLRGEFTKLMPFRLALLN